MGQVPERAALLLIGDGRLAEHLFFYLQSKNLDVTRWSRRQDASQDLPGRIAAADRVLLTIRDDAIASFIQEHQRDDDTFWIHFSGSLVVDGAWSVHPLSTFAGPVYCLETYESIPLIVEQEGPPLAELLPGLGNPSASIPRALKPLYHAYCVAAGNFTQMLWHQLFHGFEKQLGLPPEHALPYLRQTCANLERSCLRQAEQDLATGPIARRDQETIQRNLDALCGAQQGDLAKVYESFLALAAPKPLEVAA